MRTPLPASCSAFRLNFSLFDIAWIFVSPPFALYLSNAYILSSVDGFKAVILFCAVSAASSITAFLIFRFQDGVPSYFSVHDALEVAKAVAAAELITCIALFSLTRLEGVPRAALIIHAMILAAGLVAARVLVRLRGDDQKVSQSEGSASEHVMLIGSNQFSSLYIKLLKACFPRERRVIGVLDSRPKMFGRMLEGVRIVGTPQHLANLIDEYSVHGIRIDRIVIGGGPDLLPQDQMNLVRRTCAGRQIELEFVPQLVGLTEVGPGCWATNGPNLADTVSKGAENLVPSPYFRYKPIIDSFAALMLLIILIPMLLIVSLMVLFDMGSPVLFWQQRLGRNGRNFLLYKFRTLRPPFDDRGHEIPSDRRLSWIGYLLRDSGLDELPQLLNILVGEMSLIGPRPLLPEDQPAQAAGRLLVRPGITGWAQVNGGKWITAEEKVTLDQWYVEHASLWVDIVILWKTLQFVGVGARRSNETAVGENKGAPVEHWQKRAAS